jgi:hypothetical protein
MKPIDLFAGAGALALALAGAALPIALPHAPKPLGYTMLGIAMLILIGRAVVTFLSPIAPPADQSQSTSGSHSPAINAGRDVHYHAGAAPAATRPLKSPDGTARHLPSGADLLVESIIEQKRESNRAALRKGPPPDFPLAEVVKRLSKSLDEEAYNFEGAMDAYDEAVDTKIADAVVHRPLRTWGRLERRRPLVEIPDLAWGIGDFSNRAGSLRFRHPDQPGTPRIYTDITFNKAEVDRWLPPDLGPHGWMAR